MGLISGSCQGIRCMASSSSSTRRMTRCARAQVGTVHESPILAPRQLPVHTHTHDYAHASCRPILADNTGPAHDVCFCETYASPVPLFRAFLRCPVWTTAVQRLQGTLACPQLPETSSRIDTLPLTQLCRVIWRFCAGLGFGGLYRAVLFV